MVENDFIFNESKGVSGLVPWGKPKTPLGGTSGFPWRNQWFPTGNPLVSYGETDGFPYGNKLF